MGGKRCSHGKQKSRCVRCNPCPHGKVKYSCVECIGCPHGKLKGNCADCNPCPHGKVKHKCAEGVQPLPSWQTETQVRRVQRVPSRQAERPLC